MHVSERKDMIAIVKELMVFAEFPEKKYSRGLMLILSKALIANISCSSISIGLEAESIIKGSVVSCLSLS